MTAALDQTFKAYGSKLETVAGPFNPYSKTAPGDKNDSAVYLMEPGVAFLRPWIAIRNGPAFQWPLGLEGYDLVVNPLLGIHRFLGDNKVDIDVLHAGEEHFTMTGNFPGNSAPALIQALRDVVYQSSGDEGKILFVPEIMSHAQRVQIVNFQASRDQGARGKDATYSLEVVRVGIANKNPNVKTHPPAIQPKPGNKGKSAKSIHVDAKHNTLRKIALWKLGSADKWRTVYNANQKWFVSHKIQLSAAPNYRLPIGTVIHY